MLRGKKKGVGVEGVKIDLEDRNKDDRVQEVRASQDPDGEDEK